MRGLVIVKPESEWYIQEIINEAKKVDIKLVCEYKTQLSIKTVEILYAEHIDEPIYPDLLSYMTGGISTILFFEGKDTVNKLLKIKGKANKGGIRGKYAHMSNLKKVKNILHCPDTEEQTEREIALLT